MIRLVFFQIFFITVPGIPQFIYKMCYVCKILLCCSQILFYHTGFARAYLTTLALLEPIWLEPYLHLSYTRFSFTNSNGVKLSIKLSPEWWWTYLLKKYYKNECRFSRIELTKLSCFTQNNPKTDVVNHTQNNPKTDVVNHTQNNPKTDVVNHIQQYNK